MISVYIATLLRHIRKHFWMAFVNIASYTLGIATVIVLLQHLVYETSFESSLKDYKDVYRVYLDNYHSDVYQNSSACTFNLIGPELKARCPEVQHFTVVQERANDILSIGENTFLEKEIIAADTNFFKVFPIDFAVGGPATPQAGDVYVSQSIATKYFGKADPLGSPVQILSGTYTVKGVFRDLPGNTHLKFGVVYLVPLRMEPDWSLAYMYTYVRLNEQLSSFEEKLRALSKEFSALADLPSEAAYSMNARIQPISSIHLESDMIGEMGINGKMENVYTVAGIAIMILLIATFNYVNMTNAINAGRFKEAFVRKIHGASIRNVVNQHLVESMIINIFVFALAIGVVFFFAEPIETALDLGLNRVDWANSLVYLVLAAIFFLAVLVSGIIPAFFAAAGAIRRRGSALSLVKIAGGGMTRNIAFTQFVISYVLIAGAFVAIWQLSFLQSGDLGFSYSRVIALEVTPLSYQRNQSALDIVKAELEKEASIEKVSYSRRVPGEKLINSTIRLTEAPPGNLQPCDLQIVTSDYFDTYDIRFVAGRAFSETLPGDENGVVINESMAIALTATSDVSEIINRDITVDYMRHAVSFRVLGVVKNHHHEFQREKIKPLIFIPLKHSSGIFRISVKVADNVTDLRPVLEMISRTLKANLSDAYAAQRGVGVGFDVIDVGSNYNDQYTGDSRFSKMLGVMTLIAIVMAGIGFYSLSSTIALRRMKEMAVRKLHGAEVSDVSGMLLGYFLKLFGVAFFFAAPVSYFLALNWLDGFSTRIELDQWFLMAPVVVITLLTLMSVSYQISRLAIVNPVDHLKE